MSRLTTTFSNAATGKPMPGVVIDVYPTGDMSGAPEASYQADANGVVDAEDATFDNGTCSLSVQPFGFYQVVGSPGYFQGAKVDLIPYSTTLAKIPAWAWILLIFVAAYFGYKYFKNIKHAVS